MTAQQLKNSILQLAVQGKLVPQDPNDEPASVLLQRIKAEKQELIKAGKIKKDKKSSEIFRGATHNLPYAFCEQIGKEIRDISDEIPFEIPDSWEWVRLGTLAQLISDGTHKTPHYVDSGIPFLKEKMIEICEQINTLESQRIAFESSRDNLQELEAVEYADFCGLIDSFFALQEESFRFRTFIRDYIKSITVYRESVVFSLDCGFGLLDGVVREITANRIDFKTPSQRM